MSAQERLAAALREAFGPDEGAILAADPHLAQDLEDGAALRRLREALPEGQKRVVVWQYQRSATEWVQQVVAGDHVTSAPTIAQAADACREAIEAQR